MGRRKLTTNYSLFQEKETPIPVGQGEKCYGCGDIIDMRINGWGMTSNNKFYHPGDECWRRAVDRELAKRG